MAKAPLAAKPKVVEVVAEDVPPKPKRKRVRKTPLKPSKRPVMRLRYKLLLIALELLGLMVTAVAAICVLMGYSANWFAGSNFFSNLLPFAIGVLGLIVVASILLIGWWKLRQRLRARAVYLAALCASLLAMVMLWFSLQEPFMQAFGHFRTLVGGKSEAGRVTLAHQVYAAYRRQDAAQLQRMLLRAMEYQADIAEAAETFALDVNLLQGIAATESSFLPRDSADGGKGLFQITLVPAAILQQAAKALQVDKPLLYIPRHNAFIAAATLKHYLAEMHGDLFLGLLAYNIGPKNGGLRFIMQQYGASDFVTIQPYLQQLPRDYPIRVLAYALAFRVWQQEGKLLGYEEGHNAAHIQRIGIPGL